MAEHSDRQASAAHAADVHDLIRVHGARVNNLKDVDVEIPKRRHLGPGAGRDGGRVVFQGTPADLVAGRPTLTGEHLAAYVGAGADT
jgi:excinuclease UvrABC ATPase subunit